MNKEELIKFVMDRADKEYADDFPISKIPGWINEFFDKNDPERSKREDSLKCSHGRAYYCPECVIEELDKRCGALNTTVMP